MGRSPEALATRREVLKYLANSLALCVMASQDPISGLLAKILKIDSVFRRDPTPTHRPDVIQDWRRVLSHVTFIDSKDPTSVTLSPEGKLKIKGMLQQAMGILVLEFPNESPLISSLRITVRNTVKYEESDGRVGVAHAKTLHSCDTQRKCTGTVIIDSKFVPPQYNYTGSELARLGLQYTDDHYKSAVLVLAHELRHQMPSGAQHNDHLDPDDPHSPARFRFERRWRAKGYPDASTLAWPYLQNDFQNPVSPNNPDIPSLQTRGSSQTLPTTQFHPNDRIQESSWGAGR